MKYLIGIDIGTSGTKTVLFDECGTPIKSHNAEYKISQPHNGWAEQDPQDWWNATLEGLNAVAKGNNNVVGIGLSGQMHGLVMLDELGNVIRPSIIWCDQRTENECREITKKVGKDRLIKITANPALTGFTASKILWIKNNEPENYAKCRHILLPKDYIRYKLTGEFATDVSDASGTQLLDIKHRCWSTEVLEKLEIDRTLLPKLYESVEITGYVKSSVGICNGVLVVGGAGDNAAAAIGCGVVENGKAFTTIGTSGVVYAHTDEMVIDKLGRVHTFCCAVPGKWHVMGVTQSAGLSLKWFNENFCGKLPYKEIDKLAEKVPIGSNKLIYLPYLMGERTPHLNPNARGVFFGLSAIHEKNDMLRAILEGVSYSLTDCLKVLKGMNININQMVACGGGGSSALWRQMLADLYNCEVKTITSEEGPSLGVAILAGVGADVYKTVEYGCNKVIKNNAPTKPNEQNADEYKKFYSIYTTLYAKLESSFDELNNI